MISVVGVASIDAVCPTDVWERVSEGAAVVFKAQPDAAFAPLTYLSAKEVQQYGAYRRPEDRANYCCAHSIVNKVFAHWLNCAVEALPLTFGPHRKPHMATGTGVSYNLSHGRRCVLVAFYKGAVGVDVEYVDAAFDCDAVSSEAFTPAEQRCFKGDRQAFYRLWVAKEAYLKCLGTGLYRSMTDVEAAVETGTGIVLTDKARRHFAGVNVFSPYPNYIAALYLEEEQTHEHSH